MEEQEYEHTQFGEYALLIDTDSCSVEIGPVCDYILGKVEGEWTDEQITKICDYLDNRLTVDLNEHCKELCRDVFLSNHCSVEFKREKCARLGMFLQKKNYSVLVYDSEGVRQKKWSHTGNILKKSTTPKRLKEKMREIVEVASIEKWSQADFSKYCYSFYEEIKTWDLLDFCKSCGYATEKKFAKAFDTTGVSSSNAIAVNLYNDMIKYCGIEASRKPIAVGDKFRIVHIKPDNKWGIEYIGFVDSFPKEFEKYLEIDYKTCFEKYFIKPLEHYLKIYHWNVPEVSKETVFNIDDL